VPPARHHDHDASKTLDRDINVRERAFQPADAAQASIVDAVHAPLSPARLLAAWLLLAGCALTPFQRVRQAATLDEARELLGTEKPEVTKYPPHAEAWYFSKFECVLFVDGKLTQAKTSEFNEEGTYVPRNRQVQVLCVPQTLPYGPEIPTLK
jgi:hypothetical protein